jgi:hypothetical protein
MKLIDHCRFRLGPIAAEGPVLVFGPQFLRHGPARSVRVSDLHSSHPKVVCLVRRKTSKNSLEVGLQNAAPNELPKYRLV